MRRASGVPGASSELLGLLRREDHPSRKPDAEGLRAVAARLGARAGETLLVGDSRVDAETARAAGAPLVFVEWGFARDEERQELDAAPRIGRSADLIDLLP